MPFDTNRIEPFSYQSTNSVVNNQPITDLEKYYIDCGLVDIHKYGPTIIVDIEFAKEDNVLFGEKLYDMNKCYLHKEAALKLADAQKILKRLKPGYSLIISAGTRPVYVSQYLWQKYRKDPEKCHYVANPNKIDKTYKIKLGSFHNYGLAVDISIVDKDGKLLDMGTPMHSPELKSQPYWEKGFLDNGQLKQEHIDNRNLLRQVMKESGFHEINIEWWHFNAVTKKELVEKGYKKIK